MIKRSLPTSFINFCVFVFLSFTDLKCTHEGHVSKMRAILLSALAVFATVISGNVCGSAHVMSHINALNLHHNGSLLETRGPNTV